MKRSYTIVSLGGVILVVALLWWLRKSPGVMAVGFIKVKGKDLRVLEATRKDLVT